MNSSKPKHAKIRMVCFDLDNTLVDFSPHGASWDFFHEKFGILDKADKIKKDYFEGKISYSEWVRLDTKLWIDRKSSKKEFLGHLKNAKAMKNSLKVLKKLKAQGLKLALISGSVDFALYAFFPKGLFDYEIIERAKFSKSGVLQDIDVFCAHEKLAHVKTLAKLEGLKMSEVAFVGDGFNDIEAMKAVGLGIAFNPRNPKVKKAAKIVIEEKDYNRLLEVI